MDEKAKDSLAQMQREGLYPLFLTLPPENIVLLKFTLESYEGLGIVRTLDAERGYVVILAVKDTIQIVEKILESLVPKLSIRPLKIPENISDDWLLRDTSD